MRRTMLTTPTRPIWLDSDPNVVNVIDQRQLPHQLVVAPLRTVDEMITAIQEMYVRGAPLIGVSGAYGTMLAAIAALHHNEPPAFFKAECIRLKAARPTAVNLAWAVERALAATASAATPEERVSITRDLAARIAEEEVENCRRIGAHGLELIRKLQAHTGHGPVNVLTHCNAGWLACVEWGTATAPIYAAFEAGLDIHVWVDETRPLNQGARLTAWELGQKGVPHTVITDNAGGHLMQHAMVDLVIVGTDRTTHTGDVANKIGTYLKALAARDNNIPFYVALPSSTFDWEMRDGLAEIPIEVRDPDEIRYVQGLVNGENRSVLVPPADSPAGNYAFDVTPARLVTGFITERGVCGASEAEIHRLFPEK
jgi:methylthioribose-1-phosphate isomerase